MNLKKLKKLLKEQIKLLKEQGGETIYTNWFIGLGPIVGGYEWTPTGYDGPNYATNGTPSSFDEEGGCSFMSCCGNEDYMHYCAGCSNIEDIITFILQNSDSSNWINISDVFSDSLSGDYQSIAAESMPNNWCINPSNGLPYTIITGGFQLPGWVWNGYELSDNTSPAYPGYGIIAGGAHFYSFQNLANYMQGKGIDMDSMTSFQDIVNAWEMLGDSTPGGLSNVCMAGGASEGMCASWCRCTSQCIESPRYSCEDAIIGCMDELACNYMPEANTPPPNEWSSMTSSDYPPCEYESCIGCTDSEAINYSEDATEDDGSCYYTLEGCTDPNAENYNPEATEDGGMCEYKVYTCTQGWGALSWFAGCGDWTEGSVSAEESNYEIVNVPPDNVNTFSDFDECKDQCGSEPITCWKCQKGSPVMQQVTPNTNIDDVVYYAGFQDPDNWDDQLISSLLLQNTCGSLGPEWQTAPDPWPYNNENNPCKKKVDCENIPPGCCEKCREGNIPPLECENFCHCCKDTTITTTTGPADLIGDESIIEILQRRAGIKK